MRKYRDKTALNPSNYKMGERNFSTILRRIFNLDKNLELISG